MAAVTIANDFGAQENKIYQFPASPSIDHQVMGPDAIIFVFPFFVFWPLSFKPAFSLPSFTFIKRLFSSSSFSAVRVVSSAYLRLLVFLQATLRTAVCASSSQAFHMMYYAYELNNQGDNIQPSLTPFPIWNQSVIPCPVLTVASWSAYNFLRRQIRWSGIPISKNFPVCCNAHKGFSVVNEADVFLEFSWFFYDPTDVGNLISGSSGFSKSSLYIWKFSVYVLWKLSLENFELYFASMWNKYNCVVWVQLLPLAWSKSGQKKKEMSTYDFIVFLFFLLALLLGKKFQSWCYTL